MRSNDLDATISQLVREGPEEAPRPPVVAALAHARAHPRHGRSGNVVPAGPDATTWPGALPGLLRRRPLLGFGGLAAAAAIVLVVSFGLLAPVRLPSGPDLPVVAPSATAAAVDAADLAALTGTWTGTIDEVGHFGDTFQGDFWGSRIPNTSWDATLTFGGCRMGLACGSMDLRTSDYSGTGTPRTCRIALTLSGGAGLWSTFSEDPVDATNLCDLGSLDAKVGAGAAAASADMLTVEDFKDGNLLRHGTLARSAEPPAVTGTWTGTITEIGHWTSSIEGVGWGVIPDTRWTATLTFDGCGVGVACGSMDLQTSDYSGSGEARACRIALTLSDPGGAGRWSTFTEEPAGPTGTLCDLGVLSVRVVAGSAGRLSVQDFRTHNLLRQGTLTRSVTP